MPRLNTSDARKTKKILEEVRQKDEEFARLLRGRRLVKLQYGQSSAVFSAGKDMVAKLTISDIDCAYTEKLYGRGKVTGWPEVFAYARVVFKGHERACVMLVERCTESLDLSDRKAQRLDAAVALVEVWFGYDGRRPINVLEDWFRLDDEQRRWAKQLTQGLVEIDRLREDVELDTFGGNYGLDAHGNAVWIDYGI
jgi:hypothetical protein